MVEYRVTILLLLTTIVWDGRALQKEFQGSCPICKENECW